MVSIIEFLLFNGLTNWNTLPETNSLTASSHPKMDAWNNTIVDVRIQRIQRKVFTKKITQ